MSLDTKYRGPGHGGSDGKRKALKSVKPPNKPNIKKQNQWNFEFGDIFRVFDMKLGGKGGGGQMPRKMDANNIMNTMQQIFQPPQGKITDYIKKFDPKNSSGAIKQHLETLDKLLKKGDNAMASLTGMMGGAQMQAIQQSVNEQQQQCPPGWRWDDPTQKCVMDCPQGEIWDENEQKCIIDTSGTYDSPTTDSILGF
jgi:hypothetical protein